MTADRVPCEARWFYTGPDGFEDFVDCGSDWIDGEHTTESHMATIFWAVEDA